MTVTYCDRCKAKVENGHLIPITIGNRFLGMRAEYREPHDLDQDVCVDCANWAKKLLESTAQA